MQEVMTRIELSGMLGKSLGKLIIVLFRASMKQA